MGRGRTLAASRSGTSRRVDRRLRIDNRKALTGILFVLKSGIPWEMLPQELGCDSSDMTCWRRLRDWQTAGVWAQLHPVLLERLQATVQIDWSRAALDSASVPAPGGYPKPGRTQRIAVNSGTKRHVVVVVDRKGIPCSHLPVGGQCPRLQDGVKCSMRHRRRRSRGAAAGPASGRRSCMPTKAMTTHAVSFRHALRRRGIIPRIARKGVESKERLGRHRWVVERTLSWLNRFRRLVVRYERRDDIHQAFLSLGCALICWRFVQQGGFC